METYDRRTLEGVHSVRQSAGFIMNYRYAEERMMRMMAGWIALTPEIPVKLEMARQLARLNVDVIEAGFPITSKGEQEGVRRIAKAGLKAEASGLARAETVDIDTAINCGVKGVHVFLASSDIHLKHKLHLTREQMLKQSADMVRYAKTFGVKVEFSAEDSTRTEIPFFKQVVKAVAEAGADRFDIPDTVGIATPQKIAEYVQAARSVSGRRRRRSGRGMFPCRRMSFQVTIPVTSSTPSSLPSRVSNAMSPPLSRRRASTSKIRACEFTTA